MVLNLDYFKQKLEEEKKQLEVQLSELGKRNPANPEDWETMPAEAGMDVRITEQSELADTFEEFENRSAIGVHLEEKLQEVKTALARMEKGAYGVCQTCGEKIDEKRLEANSAASTCIKHA